MIAESPFHPNGGCSSSSSIASFESGGSGRRRKQNAALLGPTSRNKRRTMFHCSAVPHLHQFARREQGAATDKLGSLPIMGRTHPNLKKSSIHKRNEVWDFPHMKRDPSNVLPSFFVVRKPKSSIKGASDKARAINKIVTFDKAQPLIHHVFGPPNVADVYYKAPDLVKFRDNANKCARKARCVMQYAAKIEHTYKSSIGLTSPQVLGEYLSSPQEIVGIEHLLEGQSGSRLNLRRTQKKDLMEEQCHQREEGKTDPESLARRLGKNSRISSNMARARAEYAAALD